jgi:hypothetical protein
MQMQVIDMWVVKDVLFLKTEDGGIYSMKDPYISSVRYDGLDGEPTESVTLVGNNKFWKSSEPPSQSGV